MKFLDYIALGLRNIWRRKSRSFLTILAVVIGAISIIIMLSLVLGASRIATQQLENINGLTLISVSASPEMQSSGDLFRTYTDDEATRKLNDSDVAQVKILGHVIDAMPVFGVWVNYAQLEDQEKKYRINIIAIDPDSKALQIEVRAGRPLVKGDLDKIVIGNELLKYFGYGSHPEDIIGKNITLYIKGNSVDWGPEPPKPPENAGKEWWDQNQNTPKQITAEIIGVSPAGGQDGQCYMTQEFGRRLMTSVQWEYNETLRKTYEEKRQQLYNEMEQQWQEQKNQVRQQKLQQGNIYLRPDDKPDFESKINATLIELGYNQSNFMMLTRYDNLQRSGYASILVRVDNTENIVPVAKDLENMKYGVVTAKEMLDQIKKIFYLVGVIIGAIGGIVLLVAALGIINNMLMATYERTREIGILRACGATKSNIKNMFIFEAATLGFLGGAIGLILSFVLAKIMNYIGNQIALSQSVPITNIISFPLWLIIGVLAITTFIGMVAGLFPAIRAARMDPVEALRYE